MSELIECTPIEAIRLITAMCEMEVNKLSNRLAIVNLIVRCIKGDGCKDYTDEILLKVGIKINWVKDE